MNEQQQEESTPNPFGKPEPEEVYKTFREGREDMEEGGDDDVMKRIRELQRKCIKI